MEEEEEEEQQGVILKLKDKHSWDFSTNKSSYEGNEKAKEERDEEGGKEAKGRKEGSNDSVNIKLWGQGKKKGRQEGEVQIRIRRRKSFSNHTKKTPQT